MVVLPLMVLMAMVLPLMVAFSSMTRSLFLVLTMVAINNGIVNGNNSINDTIAIGDRIAIAMLMTMVLLKMQSLRPMAAVLLSHPVHC